MNKLTTTLAGLALVAGASIAPAFAQGAFFATQPFTFAFTPASFSIAGASVIYNPFNGGGASIGTLSLTGGTQEAAHPLIYDNSTLLFTSGTTTFTDTVGKTTVNDLGGNLYSIASVGATAKNNQFNLVPGAPVPEASTVISFGALLALGGLAVLRRKSVVKNAA